jgi:hypothetical protein
LPLALVALGLSSTLNEAPALEGEGGSNREGGRRATGREGGEQRTERAQQRTETDSDSESESENERRPAQTSADRRPEGRPGKERLGNKSFCALCVLEREMYWLLLLATIAWPVI